MFPWTWMTNDNKEDEWMKDLSLKYFLFCFCLQTMINIYRWWVFGCCYNNKILFLRFSLALHTLAFFHSRQRFLTACPSCLLGKSSAKKPSGESSTVWSHKHLFIPSCYINNSTKTYRNSVSVWLLIWSSYQFVNAPGNYTPFSQSQLRFLQSHIFHPFIYILTKFVASRIFFGGSIN